MIKNREIILGYLDRLLYVYPYKRRERVTCIYRRERTVKVEQRTFEDVGLEN